MLFFSLDENINLRNINKEQLIAILRQLVYMVDPNCQDNNKSATATRPGSEEITISQSTEHQTAFGNSTVISLESLGHVKGLHWLSGSIDGIKLLATKSSASTFWLVYLHSNEPLVISFRCLESIDPKQRWLTRGNDNEIKLGEREMDDGARWDVTWNTNQSSCLISNKNGDEDMYLDGYTVGFARAPHNHPNLYTGAYWRVVVR